MNLEQAIHQRWAASGELQSLLPADNVTTGTSPAAALPYATIWRKSGRTVCRTNAEDALDEVTLEISVWHDDHDAGRAIAEALLAAFDRAAFPLAGGDRVMQMRRIAESTTQSPHGTWQMTSEFLVRVHLLSG